MFRTKNIIGAVAGAAMLSTPVLAAATDGPLAPGKSAGVKQAQVGTGFIILGALGAGILAAVAITVSNESGHNQNNPNNTFAPATTAP